MEQPELGNVGCDVVMTTATWAWGSGWTLTVTHRLSGSETFEKRVYSGRDEAEVHALVADELAALLGLA